MIDLVPDVVEEILLRLSLKSILKLKTVSKQWRSILESRSFGEKRRMIMKKLQKKPQILAAAKEYQTVRQLILGKEEEEEEEEELEMNYIRSHAAATRPWLTCDGLVCIPVPGWVNIINPSTREVLRFPSGPADVVKNKYYDHTDEYWDYFPGDWAMGFGKDKVNGSYKVVRMFFDTNQFDILDVDNGEWRKLPSPPPYYADPRRKSECVNGSIYWLRFVSENKILALDLHTEEFRDVPTPPTPGPPRKGQIVNLEDRLTLATVYNMRYNWVLDIWSMDPKDETWSNTYTIPVLSRLVKPLISRMWCRPVAVSKRGNLYFYDNKKRLFKYYPETNLVSCICLDTRVLFPFVENLLPLPRPDSAPKMSRTFGFHYLDHVPGSRNSKFCRLIQLRNPNIFLTTAVAAAALVIFRYYTVFSRF